MREGAFLCLVAFIKRIESHFGKRILLREIIPLSF